MNDQKPNGNQNSFRHTNFNDTEPEGLGFIASKKWQWNRFVKKTRLKLKQVKKTSKKVLHFSMMFYVFISTVITSTVLINPLNYWYTERNPEKIEILRKANPQEVDEMINSWKRVDERTTKERKNEIEKQFREVSDAANNLGLINTTNAAPNPDPAVEITAVNEASGAVHPLTAYNLVPGQTDSTPCIGAANQNLCFLMRERKMNVCAAPLSYPFGTIIRIPGYKGSQKGKIDDTCVVLDRMADKHPNGVDICMDQDISRALTIKQNSYITVVGYIEDWRNLAPVTLPEYQKPIR